jgi:hypothetical protein
MSQSSNEPEASGTGMQKNEQGEQYMKVSLPILLPVDQV